MFYSHELLTSRQYGVATIWLVATLGARSNLRKVTRKAILDVDIPKACDTITDPETPLALRLQASLLYGVSRVHSQQCNYVLTDTQSFRDSMRGIALVIKDLQLDLDIGRTRPEQLNLAEDSAFVPELDLMFDLSAFDLSTDVTSSRGASLLSPYSQPSSRSSIQIDEDADLVLDIPSLDTPGGFGGMHLGSGVESSVRAFSAAKSNALPIHEESAIISDPDFEIAEDGSLVVPTNTRKVEATPVGDNAGPVSESGFSARVRAEHEQGMEAEQNARHHDGDDGMILMDDFEADRLPSAEPFPAVPRPTHVSSDLPTPASPRASCPADLVAAPQRQIRALKEAQPDRRTELQNKDLGDWSNNYLNNMADLARAREQNRSAAQGKKNAAFWVLGQGIGGVQANFGDDREPHPLALFSGLALLDALMGPDAQRSPGASKRARSLSVETDEGRRVRPRTEEVQDEAARGAREDQLMLGLDDDGILIQGDDYNPQSEVGRRAGSSLPDGGSIMPWNRSASHSRMGSVQPRDISSSVGGAGGFHIPGSSGAVRSRQGSLLRDYWGHMPSASPLMGKGRKLLPSMDYDEMMEVARNAGIDVPEDAEEDELSGIIDDLAAASANDDFEQYGPAANVDTQTAQTSQWMRKTLEDEAMNFLGFVQTVLSGQVDQQGTDGDELPQREKRDDITMDALLPPEQNSAVVGAQALLHILALATKGLLNVRQDAPFGEIVLSAVPHGAVSVQSEHGDSEGNQEQAQTAGNEAVDNVQQEEEGDSEEAEAYVSAAGEMGEDLPSADNDDVEQDEEEEDDEL